MSPEIEAAVKTLEALRDRVEAAAGEMGAALVAAADAGVDLRQSDIDMVATRYRKQIPQAIERKIGALLPPVTGTLNINVDGADVNA